VEGAVHPLSGCTSFVCTLAVPHNGVIVLVVKIGWYVYGGLNMRLIYNCTTALIASTDGECLQVIVHPAIVVRLGMNQGRCLKEAMREQNK
jgi:hypothetical protein